MMCVMIEYAKWLTYLKTFVVFFSQARDIHTHIHTHIYKQREGESREGGQEKNIHTKIVTIILEKVKQNCKDKWHVRYNEWKLNKKINNFFPFFKKYLKDFCSSGKMI